MTRVGSIQVRFLFSFFTKLDLRGTELRSVHNPTSRLQYQCWSTHGPLHCVRPSICILYENPELSSQSKAEKTTDNEYLRGTLSMITLPLKQPLP